MNERLAEIIAEFPEALEPLHTTCSPNVPLSLFEGDMQLFLESGQVVSAPGVIRWDWLPHPAIRFSLEGLDIFPRSKDLSEAQLDVPKLGLSCRVSVTNTGVGEKGSHYRGLLATPVVMGAGLECNQVAFHLPNFFKFIGEPIRNGKLMTWRGRLCLRSDKWEIVLDAVQILEELIKALNSQGGFALTHTGSLRRANGGEFSYSEADDLLEAIYFFLSFCRGFWCGPILAVGRLNDVNVWQEWTHTRLTSWKYIESWFPQHDVLSSAHEINQAFHGFMARWEDDLWKEPVKHSIHWYVESNIGAGGIEGAIVLTQTALELLGWLYLVEDPSTRSCSAIDFNERMNATEKIRQLLYTLRIPIDIPTSLSNLQSEAGRLGAADGPEVFVKLRNAIVHPKKTKRDVVLQTPVLARTEAHALGLWYVEMALLHIFGYKGLYYQRFVDGGLEEYRTRVPWI